MALRQIASTCHKDPGKRYTGQIEHWSTIYLKYLSLHTKPMDKGWVSNLRRQVKVGGK
jgi:hypothetical protein